MTDQAVAELAPLVGVRAGCAAVGQTQARWYRRHRQSPPPPKPERGPALQPRALSEVERKELRRVLNSPEHVDEAPATVYAKLLDEGVYLGSVPTMYRVLRDHDEVHERRRQATHPAAKKPELLAAKPNQVYSWDITKLLGPAKWTYYYLYVIIDIYSRYVPGWMLAHAENATLAEALLADTATKQRITCGQLTVHADRGSPMTAKPVAFLLADLGVHSRPHCSNDNPYSESQFRTLKYRPEFPERFGSYQDAHAFCGRFFRWSGYAGDPPSGRWGQRAWGHAVDRRLPWRSCRAWPGLGEVTVVSWSALATHCSMPIWNWWRLGLGGTQCWRPRST